jgi:hypothetical protein
VLVHLLIVIQEKKISSAIMKILGVTSCAGLIISLFCIFWKYIKMLELIFEFSLICVNIMT